MNRISRLLVPASCLLLSLACMQSSSHEPAAGAGIASTGVVDAAAHAHIQSDYGRMPIRFEPNVGQASPSVKYLARGAGYSIGLAGRGAILGLHRMTGPHADQALLRLSLVHAKSQPDMLAERQQPSVSNYFKGNDRTKWRSNIPNYGAVRYRQVYPGIDWVVYGNPQQLEYDLVVSPQADPRRIKVRIEGADRLALDANGDLLVAVRDQTLRQLKPVIYQTSDNGGKRYVEGRYLIDHQQVAFALGDYDHSRQLVIDPTLAYSTYLGGSGSDQAMAIAVDSAGNAYIAGQTTSTDFPSATPLQSAYAGDTDAFVSKLNAAGTALIYSTYLGGSSFDEVRAIAVDSGGNAYLAGATNSTNFPTVGPIQAANGGATDVFVSKLNAAGSALLYSTYLGGGANDIAYGIAVDGSGNAYVAGSTASANYPTASPLQAANANAGSPDAFVSKLNAAGSALVYSTYLGGSSSDWAAGIAVDSAGNAYIAGQTNSTDFPTANPLQAANAGAGTGLGSSDAFVSKLNPAGSALVYSTYLGGSQADEANAIAVDSSGSAYVAGGTSSSDFPSVIAQQPTNRGQGNAFLSKFNAAGSALVYSTYFGGNNTGEANAVAVDSAGNTWIAGSTDSTAGLQIKNPFPSPNTGSIDAFVSEFSADGSTLLFASLLAGTNTDDVTAMAIDSANNVYLAGYTDSSNFITANPMQPANAGGTDAFVMKITGAASPPPPPPPVPTVSIAVSPATISLGQSATLTWSSTNATGCTGSGAWSTGESVNGSLKESPTTAGSEVYTLTCSGAGGSASASATLTVNAAPPPPAPTVSITVSPAAITLGQSATLTWSSSNASACTASGAWSGSQATSGRTPETPGATGTFTYTLSCTGPGGSATMTTTLKATAPVTATNLSGKAGGGGFGIDSLLGLGLLVLARHRRLWRGAACALLLCGLPALAQGAGFDFSQTYVGLRGGVGTYDVNVGQLNSELSDDSVKVNSIDHHKGVGVLYAGVPFYDHGLSLELGLADLGIYHVNLSTTSSNIARVANDVTDHLKPAGRGLTLGLGGPFDLGRWFAVEPHLGMLLYQSRQEVVAPNATYRNGDFGVGLDAGVTLLFHPLRPLYIGAGYECFDTGGGCNVQMNSLQVEYHFGR